MLMALTRDPAMLVWLDQTQSRKEHPNENYAREVMELFTLGEGYHNYHHEFQHDYRNGVKPWQWDPTKWMIWSLSKLGLTAELRRVPRETISSAQARVSELKPPTAGALVEQLD